MTVPYRTSIETESPELKMPKETLGTKFRRMFNTYHYRVLYCGLGSLGFHHFHVEEWFLPKHQPRVLWQITPDELLDLVSNRTVTGLPSLFRSVHNIREEDGALFLVPKYLRIHLQQELIKAYQKYLSKKDDELIYRNRKVKPMCIPPPPRFVYG